MVFTRLVTFDDDSWIQAIAFAKRRGFGALLLRGAKFLAYRLMSLPTLISIEPTSACNLRCPYCSASQPIRSQKALTLKLSDFKRIIDDITQKLYYRPLIRLVARGEPFVNKHLCDMIEYAVNRDLEVEVSTNATLLDSETRYRLLRTGLNTLIISFDGASKDIYERHRVGAAFEKVLGNIKLLCEEKRKRGFKKPHIELSYIVTKETEAEIPLMQDIAEHNLRVDSLIFKSLNLVHFYRLGANMKGIADYYLPKNDRLSRYRVENGKVVIKAVPKHCSWGQQSRIYANGEVGLCCMEYEPGYQVGNVIRDDFWTIWNSDRYRELRRVVRDRGFPMCRTCSIR